MYGMIKTLMGATVSLIKQKKGVAYVQAYHTCHELKIRHFLLASCSFSLYPLAISSTSSLLHILIIAYVCMYTMLNVLLCHRVYVATLH